jgi:kynureninase
MIHVSHAFHKPEQVYLLTHSVGLLPKSTREHAQLFFDAWQHKGGEAWGDWLLVLQDFCQSLSALLNGKPDEFCPQTNISSALVKILYALPARKSRQKIVLSELDFPSQGFVLEQAKRMGYQLDFISATDAQNINAWEAHLKNDVQLAFITHVFSENSQQNPVADITKLTKHNDIFSVVDIAQSVGSLPINIKNWSADFIVGSSIKWLCGGPGAAFLWLNLDNIERFQPIDVGWFSHEHPFEFDIHHFEYAKNAYRFLGGTPSILPFYLASSSINLINEIGVHTIYQHNQRMIDKLYTAALSGNFLVHSPKDPAKRGGSLVIQFSKPQQALQCFKKEGIQIDIRPKYGVRASPHIYTTMEDIDRFVLALSKIGASRA